MATNLYARLGLSPDAHPDVIKSAYRALAKQYHPDGAGAGDPLATAKFIELQQAYEVLGDKEARAIYDASLSTDDSEGLDIETEASIDPDEVWRRKALDHPEIEPIHTILYQYSPALANHFRLAVINDECAADPAHFAADLERQYFKKYFGENPDIVALARRLLSQGNRIAAKRLNLSVKNINPNDLQGLRELLVKFGSPQESECAAPKQSRPTQTSIDDWPSERRFGIPALVMSLIVVGISVLYFGVIQDSSGRLEPTDYRVEIDTSAKPSASGENSAEMVTKTNLTTKTIDDRVPEAQPSPDTRGDSVVPESNLTDWKEVPKVTKSDTPYWEDAVVLTEENADNLNDVEKVTNISKKTTSPETKFSFFLSDRPLTESLMAQGVNKETAEKFVNHIDSVFPLDEIPDATSITVELERQTDFADRENWYPVELAFSTAAKGSVRASVGPDGKIEVSVSHGRRIALVIGNANYRKIPWLSNPDEDAKLISTALAKLGFDVSMLVDASDMEMRSAIKDFTHGINANTEFALVYYSGHAVEINGQNYLLPVDIPSDSSQTQIGRSSISLSSILSELDRRKVATKILIVDACRDNPFGEHGASRGLAAVVAPSGTFIAYATAPGTVAMDGSANASGSPYTRALAAALRSPAPTIEDTFKAVRSEVMLATENQQIPWDGSSLVGKVSFEPVSTPTEVRDYRNDLRAKSKLPQQASPTSNDKETTVSPRVPKPRERPESNGAALKTAVERSTAEEVCEVAIGPGMDNWGTRAFEQPWVAEAKRRGLSINACLSKLGRPPVLPIPSADQQG